MQHFDSDYMEGAHPEILRRLAETNMEKTPGYGTDSYCESARKKILEACGCPEGEVYFLSGGTQTNMTVIASMLKPYQGVVAADTGHISVHEAGAIEASGHKVLTVPGGQGKLMPENLADFMENITAMKTMSTWSGRAWCIYPIRRSTERCIRRQN